MSDELPVDAIPEALREREHWICWRTECRECGERLEPTTKTCPECGEKATKKPITPDGGGFASSTDPGTWGAVTGAIEAHRSDSPDTDGIGFVFDADGLVAGVDLDDCRDPGTGEVDEWAAEVVDTLDSFTEVSPSGTGLHVYVLGFVPEGGTRSAIEGAEGHIEMYDSGRYFTVTGQGVDGAPETVEQRRDALAEVHREHVRDEDASGANAELEEFEAPEDGDGKYTLRGHPLADLREADPKLDALLSRPNPGSRDDTSESDFETCCRLLHWGFDPEEVAGIMLAHRRRGKLTEDRGNETYLERTVRKASGAVSGEATEPVVEKTSGDRADELAYWKVRQAAVAHGVLPPTAFIDRESDDGGTYLGFPGTDTYNRTLDALEEQGVDHGRERASGDRPEPRTPATEGQFTATSALAAESGGYGYWKSDGDDESWFDTVTNFTIEVESFLFSDGDRLIELTVTPSTDEDPYSLVVETKVFNDPRRFRDNVATGLTTTFDGGASDLNELKKLVGGQDAPTRTGTHHMGLHPDAGEWATPAGVLTADGWTDDPETVYIEREIGAERAWQLSPDDPEGYDSETVVEMLELLPGARFAERFLPVLGWFYAAPLRPHIQDWEGQFNTLHVTGDTGTGKSSSLALCWRLFGMHGDPLAVDDTKFSLTTAMASTNSLPMWFDEYKPGDMKDWEVDRFHTLMRKATRGGVETRGNADKSTEEYHLQAPLVISGEQGVQGPAEERRSIQTRFREGVKEPGSDTKAAFARLVGMPYDAAGEARDPEGYPLGEHALAYFKYVLGADRDSLADLWHESREHVRDLLATHGVTGVDDLPRQGLQTVHFGLSMYRRFAEEMASQAGLAPEQVDLPDAEATNGALLYVAEQFGDDGGRKSHLDTFVELAVRAAREGYLERDTHYTFVREGADGEELALKLSATHDRVSKYVADHDLGGEDLLNSPEDYRERMKESEDDPTSYVAAYSQYSPPLDRCARIRTDRAESGLEFERDAFGAAPREDADDAGESGDGDGNGGAGGARPLSNVAQDATGYATVEVKVLTLDRPENDAAPALKATLRDESAVIDAVSWDDPEAVPEEGTYRIRNAAVGEHDGRTQLTLRESVTSVERIQPGAGLALGDEPAESQDQLGASASRRAASDGGEVPDDAEGLLADARRLTNTLERAREPLSEPELVAEADMAPTRVEEALEHAVEERGLIVESDEGFIPS